MKKIIFALLILLLCNVTNAQTRYPVVYMPVGGGPSVDARVGALPDWYKNMEKYWYYRYRLVNDFLFIDSNDGPGSSIPAQARRQGSTHEAYSWTLKWADATIDLGHYIQMLAVEERLLSVYGYSTVRTQFELQHALAAFYRLDSLAEQYEYEVSLNLGPSHGYPGQLAGTSTLSWSLNGYFIRDDVPYLTLVKNGYLGNKYKHFNREGLKGTWTYGSVSGSVSGVPGVVTGNGYYDKVEYAEGDFHKRWMGTMAGYTEPPSSTTDPYYWSWPTSAPDRVPAQESIDQLCDIHLAMVLTTKYSTNSFLKKRAADALYRTTNFVHRPRGAPRMPKIIDPVLGGCVYGDNPANNCDKGGANAFGIAYGAAKTSQIYADPYGHSSTGMLVQDVSLIVPFNAWGASEWAGSMINCSVAATDNILFNAFYAATNNNWYFTWHHLKMQCNKDLWGRPQLPLVYELCFNPHENYRRADYERVLSAAPDCGTYNFSAFHDGTSYPWRDEFNTTDKLCWSGNDWLSEPRKRWFTCYNYLDSFHDQKVSTYNGLDYMVLFALFALKQGHGTYLRNMNNPYFTENFNVNFPDVAHGNYGSNGNSIQLNFLEYAKITGTYGTNAACSVRVGKKLDMDQGLNSFPNCAGCYADYLPKDYRCDEDMPFNFASVENPSSCSTCISSTLRTEYVPDSSDVSDDIEDEVRDRQIFDSLASILIASGDEEVIAYLKNMGVNVDSFIQSNKIDALYELIVNVYPNPTRSVAYIEYELAENSIVHIQLTNAIGQDLSSYIEDYNTDQKAGKHKIMLETDRLEPGVYIATINIGEHSITKKISVL